MPNPLRNNEREFRRAVAVALDALKRHLIAREEHTHPALEIDDRSGALNVLFENLGEKLVVAPNDSVRQIWVSAPAATHRLDWDSRTEKFILPRTGESLIPLLDRLISEHH